MGNPHLRTIAVDQALLLHSLALIIEKLLDHSFHLIVLAFAGMLEAIFPFLSMMYCAGQY